MKITVLGAGVVGVTTAWYLAKAGHEVMVIDRQSGVALETSFANAGEISPGYASPWAAPGIPIKAFKWMLARHSPLVFRPGVEPEAWRWLWQMLRNCTADSYARNKERIVRVAEFSRFALTELRREIGLSYDERMRGTLQIFKDYKQFEGIGRDIEVLNSFGIPFELLDREGCLNVEPALAQVRDTIIGGLRLPHDETGDCFKFTNGLAARARDIGVDFQLNTFVKRIVANGSRIETIVTDQGDFRPEAAVVAMGSYSPGLVRGLGLRLPVYPVKGYSITVPLCDPARAPESTVMDEACKVAITRLGDRIRVGGMAEISGFGNSRPERRRKTLEFSLNSLFPGCGDAGFGDVWMGLRPMTPDGTPVIGTTRYSNLFVNTGHGTLGWTMACGSARVLADIISSKRPEIVCDDLSMFRYQ